MFPYPVVNLPNILTILRVLLVPVFVFFMVKGKSTEALWVFIAAGVSDAVDGFIARAFNQRTEFGAIMDPVADKLLMISAYLVLGMMGWVPWFLSPLVILRDAFLVTGYVMITSAGRELKVRPSIAGKLTTVFQVVTVVFAILLQGEFDTRFVVLTYATALITIISGVHYVVREIKRQKKQQ